MKQKQRSVWFEVEKQTNSGLTKQLWCESALKDIRESL